MIICYSLNFSDILNRYKIITNFIFRNIFLIKNQILDQTTFGMHLFIIILHIDQQQVVSSKIPCVSSKEFFPFRWKNTKKTIWNNWPQILISVLWNHISKWFSIDPSNKILVCRGNLIWKHCDIKKKCNTNFT